MSNTSKLKQVFDYRMKPEKYTSQEWHRNVQYMNVHNYFCKPNMGV